MSTMVETSNAPGLDREGTAAISTEAVANDTHQIVSFRLSKEEYGVDIMSVQEIILLGAITEMPEEPPHVRGLINLRGNVIPIIDLRTRFGLASAEPDENTRIIVINLETSTVGMIVDAVNEVLRINPAQIEPPPTNSMGVEGDCITGVLKCEDKLIILLSLEKILGPAEASKPVSAC